MMSALTEKEISRLHVLDILHRDVLSVFLGTLESAVCRAVCLLSQQNLSDKIQQQVQMTAQ